MIESYNYKAYNEFSEKIEGEYRGSYNDFIKFIKEKNYTLINYKIKNKKLKEKKYRNKEFIFFIEELSYLINSGMNIDTALNNILKNSINNKEIEFLKDTVKLLKEGNQFSYSLNDSALKHNIKIDNLSILLLQTNEITGNLAAGLLKIKEHLDFKDKINSEIKQALAYPIFLIAMSISMVFFVFLFIVPKFSSIFTPEEFLKLPFLSRIVMETGLFVEKNLSLIFISIILLLLLFFSLKNKFISLIKKQSLLLPIIKDLTLKLQLSYFFSSLSLMLEGGIDLKKALYQSSNIITYIPLKNVIDNSIKDIQRGIKLHESFSNSELIPSNAISLIYAGENSSNLVNVLNSLGNRYIDEFKRTTKSFLSLLEPFIIILMGGIISIIVIAIMLAVMSITDFAS